MDTVIDKLGVVADAMELLEKKAQHRLERTLSKIKSCAERLESILEPLHREGTVNVTICPDKTLTSPSEAWISFQEGPLVAWKSNVMTCCPEIVCLPVASTGSDDPFVDFSGELRDYLNALIADGTFLAGDVSGRGKVCEIDERGKRIRTDLHLCELAFRF